jgi:hypothetical protein
VIIEAADTRIGMDDDTRRRCLEPLLSEPPRLQNLGAAFLDFGA